MCKISRKNKSGQKFAVSDVLGLAGEFGVWITERQKEMAKNIRLWNVEKKIF